MTYLGPTPDTRLLSPPISLLLFTFGFQDEKGIFCFDKVTITKITSCNRWQVILSLH